MPQISQITRIPDIFFAADFADYTDWEKLLFLLCPNPRNPRNLRKQYPNGKGIHGISFAVEAGELFGFLGPNGAGKSTTIRTIMGFLTPIAGSASVLGHDVATESLAVRRQVGYLPSDITLYDHLSGEQNIAFALNVRRRPEQMARAHELARRLEVDLSRRIRTLSRGQKQKVAIIRDGHIITQDTVSALKKQRVKRVAVEFQGPLPPLAALTGVTELKLGGRRAQFTYQGPPDQLLSVLAARPVVDVTLQDPSLEEIFMAFYAEQEVTAG